MAWQAMDMYQVINQQRVTAAGNNSGSAALESPGGIMEALQGSARPVQLHVFVDASNVISLAPLDAILDAVEARPPVNTP